MSGDTQSAPTGDRSDTKSKSIPRAIRFVFRARSQAELTRRLLSAGVSVGLLLAVGVLTLLPAAEDRRSRYEYWLEQGRGNSTSQSQAGGNSYAAVRAESAVIAQMENSALIADEADERLLERMRGLDRSADPKREVLSALWAYLGELGAYYAPIQRLSADNDRSRIAAATDGSEASAHEVTADELAMAEIAQVQTEIARRVRTIREMFGSLGISVERPLEDRPQDPELARTFSALLADRGVDAQFSERATQIVASVSDLRRLTSMADTLPLRAPTGPGSLVVRNFGVQSADGPEGQFHSGVDLNGTLIGVYAPATGVVEAVEVPAAEGPFRVLTIYHGNGVSTYYDSIMGLRVVVGQRVDAGQRIGFVIGPPSGEGNAGLHYEISYNNAPVDPSVFIDFGDELAEANSRH